MLPLGTRFASPMFVEQVPLDRHLYLTQARGITNCDRGSMYSEDRRSMLYGGHRRGNEDYKDAK